MNVAWWHWILLGILILGVELLIPSFIIAWIGIGAMAAGIIILVSGKMPLAVQGVIWVVLSVSFTLLWFRFVRPRGGNRNGGGRTLHHLRRR